MKPANLSEVMKFARKVEEREILFTPHLFLYTPHITHTPCLHPISLMGVERNEWGVNRIALEERNAYNRRKQWGLKVGPQREHGLSPLIYSSWTVGLSYSYHPLAHSTQFKASPFTHRLVSPSLSPYPPTRPDQHPPSNPNLNFPLPLSARPYGQRNSFNHKNPYDAELQVKIEKSICVKCDTKFSSDHRCQNEKLQVLLVRDEFPKEDIVRIPYIGEMLEADVDEIAELSINSMVGLSALKTMKLKEKIAHQEVVTMIDCGATHNFISTKLIQKLGISLQATTSYGVLMGTGMAVKVEDIYREEMCGHIVTHIFKRLKLSVW